MSSIISSPEVILQTKKVPQTEKIDKKEEKLITLSINHPKKSSIFTISEARKHLFN